MQGVRRLKVTIIVTALVMMAAYLPEFSCAAGDDSEPLLFIG